MSLSGLLKDLQVALNTIANLTKNDLKDEKFFSDLKEVLKITQKGVTDATGGAPHRLNVSKPSIDTVKELILGIPDALSVKNEGDQLPVQSAVWHSDSTKYVPILAKEGIKHEVGGRGMRGGLLAVDPISHNGKNTLQVLASSGISSDPIPRDTACLDVMKELRKANILLQSDIKEHEHLIWSCRPEAKMRFGYLAEWDPDCLMTGTYGGLPLSHATIKHWPNLTSSFIMYDTSRLPSSIIHNI